MESLSLFHLDISVEHQHVNNNSGRTEKGYRSVKFVQMYGKKWLPRFIRVDLVYRVFTRDISQKHCTIRETGRDLVIFIREIYRGSLSFHISQFTEFVIMEGDDIDRRVKLLPAVSS